MSSYDFEKYFTLEEAAAMLPEVRTALALAHDELKDLRNAVVLYKRIIETRQDSGMKPSDGEIEVMQRKFEAFEDAFVRWIGYFAERGVIMRDLETGLSDFPYRSGRTGQEFFLCWRLDEDGIFYFHGMNEGFAGRHPITLLPD